MSINNTKYILLLLLICVFSFSQGQDRLLHTQSIVKHEFLNPAYNSFRDYASLSLFSRDQWNTVTGNPKILAASFYMPVKLTGLGTGFIFLKEDIGLRDKVAATAFLSQNVHLHKKGFLSLGFGVGMQNVTYDRDKMILQDDATYVDYSDLDYNLLTTALGLFYFGKYIYSGLSSEVVFDQETDSDKWLLPGFSFVIGGTCRLTDHIFLRPDLEMKYYPDKEIVYEGGDKDVTYFDPIFDATANVLFYDRIWLGIERRFKQAQIFSVDFIIGNKLKLGYSYEFGIGDGINQFDSQSIRLSYSFMPKSARRDFRPESRYKIRNSFNNPYR